MCVYFFNAAQILGIWKESFSFSKIRVGELLVLLLL